MKDFTENRQSMMNTSKATEYAELDDRMWNFEAAAKLISIWLELKVKKFDPICTPEEAAFLFSIKHKISIVKELTNPDSNVRQVTEKYSDDSNYNDLQYAMKTHTHALYITATDEAVEGHS